MRPTYEVILASSAENLKKSIYVWCGFLFLHDVLTTPYIYTVDFTFPCQPCRKEI